MDKILKTLIFDGEISVSVISSTDMVNESINIHKLSPVCAAALGRTMTVCTFMASNLKNDGDRLYVTIKGDGAGGSITVCGNKDLDMRGSIDNPQVDLPLKPNGKLDVGGCVGTKGRITVVRSMGLKEPYSGSSGLVTGEIAEDFTAYYAISEQQPTAIALGVKIGKDLKCIGAGGVVLQAMPGASVENLEKAEKIIHGLDNISTLISELGANGVMEKYFGTTKFDTYYPKYNCLCSRDSIERVLISLGKEELHEIIKERGKVEVGCQFCNKVYTFNEDDVNNLFIESENKE